MGLGCLANAWLTRRTHCFFTGPLFLGAAMYHLLSWHGNLLPKQTPGRFLLVTYGLFALAFLSEVWLGKYLSA
jgi:hypothetical protein